MPQIPQNSPANPLCSTARPIYREEKFEAAKAKYDEKMEAFLANGGEKKARKSRKDKADLGRSLENRGTLSILLCDLTGLNGM